MIAASSFSPYRFLPPHIVAVAQLTLCNKKLHELRCRCFTLCFPPKGPRDLLTGIPPTHPLPLSVFFFFTSQNTHIPAPLHCICEFSHQMERGREGCPSLETTSLTHKNPLSSPRALLARQFVPLPQECTWAYDLSFRFGFQ